MKLALGVFCAATLPMAAALKFISIGDWGDKPAKTIAPLMGNDNPEFVIAIGDNFYNKGIKGTDDPQWKEKFEDTFTAPSLQVPWYVCAGNHDYYGGQAGINAEMAYSNISKRWTYPSLYHTKEVTSEQDKTTVLLVSIDTWRINGGDTYVKFDPVSNHTALRNATLVEERFQSGEMEKGKRDTLLRMFKEEDPSKPPFQVNPDLVQLQWLDKTLSESTADWTVVFGHFPVFSITTGEHGDTPSLIKYLYPILQRNKVDMYFNGHDHILQHIQKEKGGTHFFGSGAGAREHTGVNAKYEGLLGYSEGNYGYMLHEGNATTMKTSFRIAGGKTPYEVTIVKSSDHVF